MSTLAQRGWIGVDLDGTLAHYDRWVGPEHIGAPIPEMVERVQNWLARGVDVRIFTARVGPLQTHECVKKAITAINIFCLENFNQRLAITATKDLHMIELWDDRCVCVKRNVGSVLGRNPEADTTKDSIAITGSQQ